MRLAGVPVAFPRSPRPRELPDTARLLAAAADPRDSMTLAFAGVIGRTRLRATPYDVPVAGLDARSLSQLSARFFPRLATPLQADGAVFDNDDTIDEFDDLVELLLDHRASLDPSVDWLAHAIATASMEGNHLWQDLGLPDRGVLNALLRRHFPALAAKNVGDMKWKKFFYRELCKRAEVLVCKSPVCSACVNYAKCFGPET